MSIMLLLARIGCILLEARTVHFCSWIVIEVFTHNSPCPSYLKRGILEKLTCYYLTKRDRNGMFLTEV